MVGHPEIRVLLFPFGSKRNGQNCQQVSGESNNRVQNAPNSGVKTEAAFDVGGKAGILDRYIRRG